MNRKYQHFLEDLVFVEWLDSCSGNTWEDKHSSFELAKCKSVGWVFHVGDDCLTLAATLDPDGDSVNSYITIPFVNIKTIRVVDDG